jgi:hypothetical protein
MAQYQIHAQRTEWTVTWPSSVHKMMQAATRADLDGNLAFVRCRNLFLGHQLCFKRENQRPTCATVRSFICDMIRSLSLRVLDHASDRGWCLLVYIMESGQYTQETGALASPFVPVAFGKACACSWPP